MGRLVAVRQLCPELSPSLAAGDLAHRRAQLPGKDR